MGPTVKTSDLVRMRSGNMKSVWNKDNSPNGSLKQGDNVVPFPGDQSPIGTFVGWHEGIAWVAWGGESEERVMIESFNRKLFPEYSSPIL